MQPNMATTATDDNTHDNDGTNIYDVDEDEKMLMSVLLLLMTTLPTKTAITTMAAMMTAKLMPLRFLWRCSGRIRFREFIFY